MKSCQWTDLFTSEGEVNEEEIIKTIESLFSTEIYLIGSKNALLKLPAGYGYCEYDKDGVPKIWNGHKCITPPSDFHIDDDPIYIVPIKDSIRDNRCVKFKLLDD